MTPMEFLSEELHISNGFHAIEDASCTKSWPALQVRHAAEYVLHYDATHAGL